MYLRIASFDEFLRVLPEMANIFFLGFMIDLGLLARIIMKTRFWEDILPRTATYLV